MAKLYSVETNVIDIETPVGLLNQVWFEIMYYLCRRGQENLRSMTKTTFDITTASTGRRYAYKKVDELDKNHQDLWVRTLVGKGVAVSHYPRFCEICAKIRSRNRMGRKKSVRQISEKHHFVSKKWTFFVMEMEIYYVQITKTHRQINKY